jgi:NOL1/NOP2/sun family putative RNA methylase
LKEHLPSAFTSHLENLLGKKAKDLINSFSIPPPVSIRVNLFKKYNPPAGLEKIPWCSTGFYLPVRPVFTLDPAFHAGGYYVQEASSMFLEQAISQIVKKDEPVKVLDISAAPGGKSTHLINLLHANSLLIANEVIRSRAQILKENIIRWGASNVIVTSSDPQKFEDLQEFFDVIVVDAPCSGEGLFRKDTDAVKEWSPENVNLCALRQKRILKNVWPALKQGGHLIYSTCTFQTRENEEQLSDFIINNNARSFPIEIENEWNLEVTETPAGKEKLYGYRFYPHKLKGEGFFLSVIRKEKDIFKNTILKPKKKITEIKSPLFAEYISSPDNYLFFEHNSAIFSFPKNRIDELNFLSDKLNIVYAGVETGKIAGKDFIPAHALALSTIVSNDVPTLELNDDVALQYLRKSEVKIDTSEKGWMLVKYQNLNLGWIKILKNRINNYYPREYRIRI